MDRFVSTRGTDPRSLAEAVLTGTAPDGGLYVPAALDPDSVGVGLANLTLPPAGPDFEHFAQAVAPDLFPSVDVDGLRGVVAGAFDFPVPIHEVDDDVHLLELTHGPTHAFKDFGARFLGRLAAYLNDGSSRTVLVATSGDTGGAVADAFAGVPDFRVVVLFPAAGVTERQRRQMSTVGRNVFAVAVDGDFDDCQRLVKEAFSDPTSQVAHGLMSANSINVGRLLPQCLYYLYAAARLKTAPTFVVPSGNLGNLCAGLIARRLGLPTEGFVAALNANRAFADFLETGSESMASTKPTLSTAMDVSRPSNLERIRWLHPDRAELGDLVSAVSVSDQETLDCITRVHDRTGYVLDPHSAVGYVAGSRLGALDPWSFSRRRTPPSSPKWWSDASGSQSTYLRLCSECWMPTRTFTRLSRTSTRCGESSKTSESWT